jgi:sec-independent protein translocase protein TatA
MFSGLLQPTHLVILAVIALVFLGAKRIPEAGRALGQGLSEFKDSIGGGHGDDQQLPAHTTATPEESSRSM